MSSAGRPKAVYGTKCNPLEEMTWEERFMEAWKALLVMEHRAEDAEACIRKLERPINFV
jgi:hypothetical protein